MVKRLLTVLLVTGLVTAFLAATVSARSSYPWLQKKEQYRLERLRIQQLRQKATARQMATPDMEQRALQRSARYVPNSVSLGSAGPSAVQDSGFIIIQTYEDWQYSLSKKRVKFNGTPQVHFSVTEQITPAAGPGFNWMVYDPTDVNLDGTPPSWVVGVGGTSGGDRVQTSDLPGLWPSLAVRPGDGSDPIVSMVVLAGVDSTAAGFDNAFYYKDPGYSGIWNNSPIQNTQYSTVFTDPAQSVLNHPAVEAQVCGSDTLLHVVAHESRFVTPLGTNPLATGTKILYFRKVDWGDTATWFGPTLIDSATYRGALAAERNGCKVAVSYVRPRFPDSTNYCTCDADVFYRESVDGGVTWGPRTNASNYDRSVPSESPWIETDCMYDSQGRLHIIWNGNGYPANPYSDPDFAAYVANGESGGVGFWNEFSCNLVHWSEATGVVSKIADANYGIEWNTQVCGFGGFNMMYIGAFNIAECNNRLYVTWSQWNDVYNIYNRAQPTIDDCAADLGAAPSRVHAANGEINLSVSSTLDGLLWDLQRNLTDSYTPNCDTVTGGTPCSNDTKASMSIYGLSDAAFAGTWGTLTWPDSSDTFDPTGTYAGDAYIQMIWLVDRAPGPAAFDLGDAALNDIRYARLACVDPVTAPLIKIAPDNAGYPDNTPHGVPDTITVTITNDGNATLNISAVLPEETTGPAGWLATTLTAPLSIPAGIGNTATFDVIINDGGIVNSPGTVVALSGRIRIVSDAPSPRDTVDFVIDNFIVGDVQARELDSVNTGTIILAVSNNGEWGESGIGGANLDFTDPGSAARDCDTTQDIYLFDGGPLFIQEITPGTDYRLSANLYLENFVTNRSFVPIPPSIGGVTSGSFVGPGGSDAYRTSTFASQDSVLYVEQEIYAPTDGAPYDDFVIVCTKFYSPDPNVAVPNLLLGDVIDWDVPSSSTAINISGISGKAVYLQGVDDTTNPCVPYSGRFAGAAFLGMYLSSEYAGNNCVNNTDRWGTYAANNTLEQDTAQNGAIDSALVWNTAAALTGEWSIPDTADLRTYVTYVHDTTAGGTPTGYTLPAGETLTVYIALTSVYNGTADDFADNLKNACAWYQDNIRPGCAVCSCCQGSTGNVNNDPGDVTDIADLTALIDNLFINFTPIACPEEANINGDPGGVIDIADLTALIDHLFINFTPTAPCQ